MIICCVSPVAHWEGWYHNEEWINASKYGYTYEILERYLFECKPLFKDSVDNLFIYF